MIWRPKTGQRVELRYAAKWQRFAELFGGNVPNRIHATIIKVARGPKQLNVLVETDFDYTMIVVPRGQLFIKED